MRYMRCSALAHRCHLPSGPFVWRISFLCPSFLSLQLLWLHRLWVTLVTNGSLCCRTGVGEAAEGAYEALCTVGGADGHVLPIPAAGAFTAGDGSHVQSSCCSWVAVEALHAQWPGPFAGGHVLLVVAACAITARWNLKPYATQLRQLGNTDRGC